MRFVSFSAVPEYLDGLVGLEKLHLRMRVEQEGIVAEEQFARLKKEVLMWSNSTFRFLHFGRSTIIRNRFVCPEFPRGHSSGIYRMRPLNHPHYGSVY